MVWTFLVLKQWIQTQFQFPHNPNRDMRFIQLASGGFQDRHPGLPVTVRHGSSLSDRQLSVGIQRRSSSAAFCNIVCCQTNLQQLWRQVFCSCRSEVVKQPSSWSVTISVRLLWSWHMWQTVKATSHKFYACTWTTWQLQFIIPRGQQELQPTSSHHRHICTLCQPCQVGASPGNKQ